MRPPISTARRTALLIGALLVLQVAASRGSVDDAQSFALQAAEPYVKEGFQVREDYWGGDLGRGGEKSGAATAYSKATNTGSGWAQKWSRPRFRCTFMIRTASLCEQPDSWQKGHFAAAHLIPKTTGSYFVIVGRGELAGRADPLGAGLRVPVGVDRTARDLGIGFVTRCVAALQASRARRSDDRAL